MKEVTFINDKLVGITRWSPQSQVWLACRITTFTQCCENENMAYCDQFLCDYTWTLEPIWKKLPESCCSWDMTFTRTGQMRGLSDSDPHNAIIILEAKGTSVPPSKVFHRCCLHKKRWTWALIWCLTCRNLFSGCLGQFWIKNVPEILHN